MFNKYMQLIAALLVFVSLFSIALVLTLATPAEAQVLKLVAGISIGLAALFHIWYK